MRFFVTKMKLVNILLIIGRFHGACSSAAGSGQFITSGLAGAGTGKDNHTCFSPIIRGHSLLQKTVAVRVPDGSGQAVLGFRKGVYHLIPGINPGAI